MPSLRRLSPSYPNMAVASIPRSPLTALLRISRNKKAGYLSDLGRKRSTVPITQPHKKFVHCSKTVSMNPSKMHCSTKPPANKASKHSKHIRQLSTRENMVTDSAHPQTQSDARMSKKDHNHYRFQSTLTKEDDHHFLPLNCSAHTFSFDKLNVATIPISPVSTQNPKGKSPNLLLIASQVEKTLALYATKLIETRKEVKQLKETNKFLETKLEKVRLKQKKIS